MKIALGRGPGEFGGIFRRFREVCACASGRHTVFGMMPMAATSTALSAPVPTYAYDRRLVSWRLVRAQAMDEVLDACDAMIARIAADLDRERPDRVVAPGTDIKGVVMTAAARRAGIPVATFVAGFEATEAQFDGTAVPTFARLAERYCLTMSDRLIFPSRFAAAHAAREYPGVTLAPAAVVYNGIAAPFLDAPPAIRDPARIGAVMRTDPVKNPAAIGEIAMRLRARGVALEVVTNAAAEGLAVFQNARVLPPTLDTRALAAQYGEWRALVAPSRFEASGNVPMEALAVGTPAVVTDHMGVAEILRDLGLDHLIVPVDDFDRTADVLMNAQPISREIRAHLRSTFAWPAVAERLIAAL